MSLFITFKNFSWEYEEYGTGEALLIAFPGFDRLGSDFKVFESTLGKHYKIIAFNLFYHGKSSAPATNPTANFKKDDLKGLIEKLLTEKQQTEFSLLAYSLGGKIALSSIELFPQQVKAAYLFAPDGIKINIWYRIASQTSLGRTLFRIIMKYPAPFLKLADWLAGLKLVNEKLRIFAHHQLETKERRDKVFNIWVVFRKIIPDIKAIWCTVNKNKIEMHLFFGKYDVVIQPKLGIFFASGLDQQDALKILEIGHNLITEKTNKHLQQLIDAKNDKNNI